MWFLLTLLLLVFTPITVFAQSVGDLYQKSISSGNNYRQAYSNYLTAKNQHIQYGTGATRIASFDATKKVLVSRNTWQIDFLTYLRSYLAESTGVGNYSQTVVYLDLENEISSLNALNSNLGSGDTVEAINKNSKDWESRLINSDKLASAATIQIITAKLTALQNQLQTFVDASQSSDTTTLNLIHQKLQSSIDLRIAVEKNLGNYKNSSWSKISMLSQLSECKQLLLDAATLLNQISTTH